MPPNIQMIVFFKLYYSPTFLVFLSMDSAVEVCIVKPFSLVRLLIGVVLSSSRLPFFQVPEWVMLSPGILLFGYGFISLLSYVYQSITEFPWKTILVFLLLFFCLALPLQLVGTLIGRSINGNPHNPCRVSSVPSEIPTNVWYGGPGTLVLVSGILPFGCIFVEVFFVFASIWSYKYYYMYGFLIAITGGGWDEGWVCESIVVTYLLLNSENYHWRWTSFLSGMSIGLYLFLYCIYFYLAKTQMSGLLQAVVFFTESVHAGAMLRCRLCWCRSWLCFVDLSPLSLQRSL